MAVSRVAGLAGDHREPSLERHGGFAKVLSHASSALTCVDTVMSDAFYLALAMVCVWRRWSSGITMGGGLNIVSRATPTGRMGGCSLTASPD
jgi:hypothetical protein